MSVPSEPRPVADDETQPEAELTTAADVPADEADEPHLTRRERRAKAGGPAAKVYGPQGGKSPAMPAKGRDYAHRRRG